MITHFHIAVSLFRARNTKVYKIRKLCGVIFSTVYNIFQPNFTILLNRRCSFPAVIINSSNSKVYPIGSILFRYSEALVTVVLLSTKTYPLMTEMVSYLANLTMVMSLDCQV